MAKPSSKRTRTPAYPPISQQGYEAACLYLDQALAHAADPSKPEANTSLLSIGLPQGSIMAITPQFGVQVRDTGLEGHLRNPRHVDPEMILVVRLLLLPGGSIGLNRKNMNRPNRKDYPHLRWSLKGVETKIPLSRLIADTQPGYQTPIGRDHYSLRRADLPAQPLHVSSTDLTRSGRPTKTPHLGRADAIRSACELLELNAHRLTSPITPIELRRQLIQAFALLDARPLGVLET